MLGWTLESRTMGDLLGGGIGRLALVLLLVFGWMVPIKAQAAPATSADATVSFDQDAVVAKIGDRQLTLGELMFRFAALPPEVRGRYGARLDVYLEDLVSNLTVVAEAERLGVDQDPLYESLMQLHREEVLRDLYARQTVLSQIDEATLSQRYKEQLENRFRRRPRVRLRHILVTPVAEARPFHKADEDAVTSDGAWAKAQRLKLRLASGDIEFEALARLASEDASAPQGGDLGWLDPEVLDPILAKGAMLLPVGEVSKILETQLGLHLVQVVDRRPAGVLPLEVVDELLYQEIVGEQVPFFGDAVRQDRLRLLNEAEIELYPQLLPW